MASPAILTRDRERKLVADGTQQGVGSGKWTMTAHNDNDAKDGKDNAAQVEKPARPQSYFAKAQKEHVSGHNPPEDHG